MEILRCDYRDWNGDIHGEEVDIDVDDNRYIKSCTVEKEKLNQFKVGMQEISTAVNELVEKMEYLFSNLDDASNNQLEVIEKVKKTVGMLYVKVLFEEYKRS